jgi:DNA-binding transcriptional MerR regulator
MPRTALLRIGEFARASSLSIKALRVYHETGLLVPAVVDPDTGYRAYSPAQLTDAAMIRVLREVGVSLPDIHTVLDARDLGLLRKVLAEQSARFQAGLDAVARVVDDLALDDDTGDGDGAVLRPEPARTVLAIDGVVTLADLEPFLQRSAELLHDAAAAGGAVIDGCLGASYPPPVDDDHQDVTVFLPVAAAVMVPSDSRAAGVRIDELPACDVAVVEHRGPYWGLDACYRRLGAWVAFHATPSGLPVREWYLALPDGDGDAVTELCWPVETGGER